MDAPIDLSAGTQDVRGCGICVAGRDRYDHAWLQLASRERYDKAGVLVNVYLGWWFAFTCIYLLGY